MDLEEWFQLTVIIKKRKQIADKIVSLANEFNGSNNIINIPTLEFPNEADYLQEISNSNRRVKPEFVKKTKKSEVSISHNSKRKLSDENVPPVSNPKLSRKINRKTDKKVQLCTKSVISHDC